MTAENDELKKMNLTELRTINQLDLSGGFTCDVETGICGPTDGRAIENMEENKNENNDMV